MKLIKNSIVFLLMLIAFNSFSQSVKNKQLSLIGYDLTISKDFAQEISSLEPFIKGIKTYNDPGNDKLRVILIHIIYYTFTDKLREQLEVEILPVNTFQRKVKYDDYGYPKASAREAIRLGGSKYYFKLDVAINSVVKAKKAEFPEMFENKNNAITYPEITVTVTLYNKDGVVPIDKWVGVSNAKYPLDLNEYLLKGFDNSEMVVLPEEEQQKDNLYLIMDRALFNAIQDYYTKD